MVLRTWVSALLAGIAMAGCVSGGVITCDDGMLCPAAEVCAPAGGGCVEPGQLAACVGKAPLAPCTVSLIPDGICVDAVCVAAGCGNGVVEPDEVCDDGNTHNHDGCSDDCQSQEICGNGIVDVGEQCDGSAECRADCTIITCGDGHVDPLRGEACDAGAANSNAPDAPCRLTCQVPACGDGVIDPALGEVCDDGNHLAHDGCRPDCRSTSACGNGVLDGLEGEGCDDGNTRNLDGCGSTCLPEQATWHPLVEATPSARYGHAIAYDAARRRVVLFSGRVDNGSGGFDYFDDTWEYDGAGWTQMTPATQVPPPRLAGAMAYDAALGRVVLFGGQYDTNLGDTWTWDGVTWTQLTPATSPSGRLGTALAYDADRRVLVLFGGWPPGARVNDTWEFDGVTWTEAHPLASPSARQGHAMAYDAAYHRLVLFGGDVEVGPGQDDTWTYDGTTWTQLADSGPCGYKFAAIAYDALRTRTVIAGCGTQTWALTGAALADVHATGAPWRSGPGLVYDAALDVVLSFGGGDPSAQAVGETWQLDGAAWSQRTPPSTPAARRGAAMAYDSARERTVLFGGAAAGSADLDDTWDFDGAHWAARPLALRPPARSWPMMAYDPGRGRVVLFGGDSGGAPRADTWEFDGAHWAHPTPATSPPGRARGALAYDASRGRVVLFGGAGAGGLLGDTWEYDGVTWAPITGATSPAPRAGHGLAYDAAGQRLVLFGGTVDGVAPEGETWVLTAGAWTQVMPALTPPPRVDGVVAYDPGRRQVVVTGGAGVAGALGDAWVFDRGLEQWTPIANQVDGLPVDVALAAPRTAPAAAFDRARSRLVLFGGDDGSGAALGDAWALGFDARTPTEACSGGAGVDYDDDALVGCDDDDCWTACSPLCPPEVDPAACPALPVCGDDVCSAFEDCGSCPVDCSFTCASQCGDFLCDAAEDAATCPADCAP